MDDVNAFVQDFLAHEGTQLYDPVKAREYYLRTRELKGRTSSAGLKTKRQKEAFAIAKSGLSEAKKEESKVLGETRNTETKALREKASAQRIEIRDKLKAIMERLTANRKADLEDIAADVESKIAALPPIPKGLSPKQRQERALERSEEIAKIRGDAATDRADVSADTKATKTSERESVKAEREALGSELKASIDKARETYETLKTEMKAKYEAETQSEYDSIKKSKR